MNKVCFTIGYANISFEEFIKTLRKYEINCIVDVRSKKEKDEKSHYSMNNIKSKMNQMGIYYISMGQELAIDNLCIKYGSYNYEFIRKDENFNKGVGRIVSGLNKGYKIALISKEDNPINSYNSIIIGYELQKKAINLKHIIDSNNIISQEDLEERLVKSYGTKLIKKIAELSINSIMKNVDLDMDERDFRREMIEEAYRMKASELVRNFIETMDDER